MNLDSATGKSISNMFSNGDCRVELNRYSKQNLIRETKPGGLAINAKPGLLWGFTIESVTRQGNEDSVHNTYLAFAQWECEQVKKPVSSRDVQQFFTQEAQQAESALTTHASLHDFLPDADTRAKSVSAFKSDNPESLQSTFEMIEEELNSGLVKIKDDYLLFGSCICYIGIKDGSHTISHIHSPEEYQKSRESLQHFIKWGGKI